ncbi:hypothetical protein ACETU7_15275 [Rhodococcus sp. 3Y1]
MLSQRRRGVLGAVRPTLLQFRINQSTISSSPVGTRYGEMLKPSEAPLRTQWTN